MKSSILYSFLLAALFVTGCRKDDNPKVPDLEEVPLPQITLKTGETKIPGDDPAGFSATVTVDTYYKFGLMPKYYDLVVIKNGDKSNPKMIQANITTFPTDVTITGQQLIDLFGANIGLGDAFHVGADVVTLDDKKFAAFPEGGETYAPGIANLPGINTQLRFAAPCLYDPADFATGDYEVLADEWLDYTAGETIAITKINDTQFSFKYKTANAQPLVFTVDPSDNSLSLPLTHYGDYGGINVSAQSVAGSEVDPCDGTFTLILNHIADPPYGDLGNAKLQFRRL